MLSDDDDSDPDWDLMPPDPLPEADPIPRWRTEHTKAVRRARNTSERGRERLRRWSNTTVGKASRKRKYERAKETGYRSKWAKTESGKASLKASNKRAYDKKMSDAGKKLMERIGVRIANAIREPGIDSARLTKYTEFENSDAIATHFESTFEPWMSFDNYGAYRLNEPRRWSIGHKIPLSKYDANDMEDFRRCWSKDNLFAQCAKENNLLKDTMPPDTVLKPLKHVWPKSWGDSV